MNVVDSSGWLEYFARGLNATFFRSAIQDTTILVVPTICLYEVYKWVATRMDDDEALAAIAWMATGKVVDLNQEIAIQAADYSREYKLPMADSIIYATARAFDATLWTQDIHFDGLEGVKFIAKK
jgi:predicted nucleic acid-binding protein